MIVFIDLSFLLFSEQINCIYILEKPYQIQGFSASWSIMAKKSTKAVKNAETGKTAPVKSKDADKKAKSEEKPEKAEGKAEKGDKKKRRVIPWSPVRNRMRKLGANMVQGSAVTALIRHLISTIDTVTKRSMELVKYSGRSKITDTDIQRAIEDADKGMSQSNTLSQVESGIAAMVEMFGTQPGFAVPDWYLTQKKRKSLNTSVESEKVVVEEEVEDEESEDETEESDEEVDEDADEEAEEETDEEEESDEDADEDADEAEEEDADEEADEEADEDEESDEESDEDAEETPAKETAAEPAKTA